MLGKMEFFSNSHSLYFQASDFTDICDWPTLGDHSTEVSNYLYCCLYPTLGTAFGVECFVFIFRFYIPTGTMNNCTHYAIILG